MSLCLDANNQKFTTVHAHESNKWLTKNLEKNHEVNFLGLADEQKSCLRHGELPNLLRNGLVQFNPNCHLVTSPNGPKGVQFTGSVPAIADVERAMKRPVQSSQESIPNGQ